ncbi:MAG TPA: hypothetical protein VFP43_08820 [Mesorhizobium sp.]|nr:hypothetical protein [Mesorhizobium sp.]
MPRYRDLVRKIVDNIGNGPRDRTMNWPRHFGFQTASSVDSGMETRWALNLSVPGWAGAMLTRSDAGIDPGDPGSRRRIGSPPHGTGRASATYLPARIALIRATNAVYQRDRSPSERS